MESLLSCSELHPSYLCRLMIKVGEYNKLEVLRLTGTGAFLEDGKDGLLLPIRFVPEDLKIGDELEVFIYHDSEGRLITTTLRPFAIVGEMAFMKVISTTPHGAFLDWGLMKDLFVPRSKQVQPMEVGEERLVKLYIDDQTGRVAATEYIEQELSNEDHELTVHQIVELMIFRKTELGYAVVINGRHLGLLYFNEVFQKIAIGDKLEGYIKTIRPDTKIDVALGKPGYRKVEDEAEKILRLLQENEGFLPYHDKSTPLDIYAFFGMSKKTFKMTVGKLFKERKIELTKEGMKAVG